MTTVKVLDPVLRARQPAVCFYQLFSFKPDQLKINLTPAQLKQAKKVLFALAKNQVEILESGYESVDLVPVKKMRDNLCQIIMHNNTTSPLKGLFTLIDGIAKDTSLPKGKNLKTDIYQAGLAIIHTQSEGKQERHGLAELKKLVSLVKKPAPRCLEYSGYKAKMDEAQKVMFINVRPSRNIYLYGKIPDETEQTYISMADQVALFLDKYKFRYRPMQGKSELDVRREQRKSELLALKTRLTQAFDQLGQQVEKSGPEKANIIRLVLPKLKKTLNSYYETMNKQNNWQQHDHEAKLRRALENSVTKVRVDGLRTHRNSMIKFVNWLLRKIFNKEQIKTKSSSLYDACLPLAPVPSNVAVSAIPQQTPSLRA